MDHPASSLLGCKVSRNREVGRSEAGGMRGEQRSDIILRGEDRSEGTAGRNARADSLAIVLSRAEMELQQSQLHR